MSIIKRIRLQICWWRGHKLTGITPDGSMFDRCTTCARKQVKV